MENISRQSSYRTIQESSQYPSKQDFDDIVQTYLDNLSFKKRDKALIDRQRYDLILQVLQEPKNTSVSTAQFRFWVKKMFQLVSLQNGHLVVCHDNKPVAMKEQIYHILTWAHRQSHHGGRDKTSTLVRRRFSWIPKELIARFVRHCPFCIIRRNGHAEMFSTYATIAPPPMPAQQEDQPKQQHYHHSLISTGPAISTTSLAYDHTRSAASVYQSPTSSPQQPQCQTEMVPCCLPTAINHQDSNILASPTSALSDDMFYPMPTSILSSSSTHSMPSSANIVLTTSSSSSSSSTTTGTSSSISTSTSATPSSSCGMPCYMDGCCYPPQQRHHEHPHDHHHLQQQEREQLQSSAHPSPEELFKEDASLVGLTSPSHSSSTTNSTTTSCSSMNYYAQQQHQYHHQQHQLPMAGYNFMHEDTMDPSSHTQTTAQQHHSLLVSPTSPLSPIACDFGAKQPSVPFGNQHSLNLMSFF